MPPSLKKPSHGWNPRISVFILWSAPHFFLLEKKLLHKVRPLPHPPKQSGVDRGRGRDSRPAGQGRLAPLGGRCSAFSPLARRRNRATAETAATVLLSIVLSLQEGKLQNKFDVAFTRTVIAVLFKDVTVTPPTEHSSDGNGASFVSSVTAYPGTD